MKTLQDILAEVQALATVPEDQFETSLATVITDLQAFIAVAVQIPVADSIVEVDVITASGVKTVFSPQAAAQTTAQ